MANRRATAKTPEGSEKQSETHQAEGTELRGRSAFNVELSAAGVVVKTVFVAEDESVHALPAVFPNLEYALNQIDALRAMVAQQFATAAQLGMQSLNNPDSEARDDP